MTTSSPECGWHHMPFFKTSADIQVNHGVTFQLAKKVSHRHSWRMVAIHFLSA